MTNWVICDGETWVSRSAAVKTLGVSRDTVTMWVRKGFIPHVLTPGGHVRFRLQDLQALAKVLNGDPEGGETSQSEETTQNIAGKKPNDF